MASMFYGHTRQTLQYHEKGEKKQAIKREAFTHFLININENKSLYDSLDELFETTRVEFQNGDASRQVQIEGIPPVLQIQLQRGQFDKRTGRAFKSNCVLQFDREIFLARYMTMDCDGKPAGTDQTDIARKIWQHRESMCESRKLIKKLCHNDEYPMPVPEMLEATAKCIESIFTGDSDDMAVDQPNNLIELDTESKPEANDASVNRVQVLSTLKATAERERQNIQSKWGLEQYTGLGATLV